jgi:predicted nucleic acid-binding protein
VAGLIILDANILIGFLDAHDVHHADAIRLLEESIHEEYAASVLTVAEVLVHPSKKRVDDAALRALHDIGVIILPLRSEDASALARVRAKYHVRMPDAVALHAALATNSMLATFDQRLATVARNAGLITLGTSPAP